MGLDKSGCSKEKTKDIADKIFGLEMHGYANNVLKPVAADSQGVQQLVNSYEKVSNLSDYVKQLLDYAKSANNGKFYNKVEKYAKNMVDRYEKIAQTVCDMDGKDKLNDPGFMSEAYKKALGGWFHWGFLARRKMNRQFQEGLEIQAEMSKGKLNPDEINVVQKAGETYHKNYYSQQKKPTEGAPASQG